jgi:hypothetical protein
MQLNLPLSVGTSMPLSTLSMHLAMMRAKPQPFPAYARKTAPLEAEVRRPMP